MTRSGESRFCVFVQVPVRVDELDRRKALKIIWMDGKMKTEDITVYPDKAGTVKTILEEVKKQVQLSESGIVKLR